MLQEKRADLIGMNFIRNQKKFRNSLRKKLEDSDLFEKMSMKRKSKVSSIDLMIQKNNISFIHIEMLSVA